MVKGFARPEDLRSSLVPSQLSRVKKVVGSELIGPDDGIGCHHGPVDMRSEGLGAITLFWYRPASDG